MDSKYNIPKKKKAETPSEILAEKIEELVMQRDKETNPVAKKALQSEIERMFARYQRSNL